MKHTKLLLALVFSASTFTACNKADDATPANTQPNPQTPIVGDVDGAFVSLKVNYAFSYPGVPSVPIEMDNAVATLFNGTNTSSYVDAGAITVNSFALDKQSNNSYIRIPAAGSTTMDMNYGSGSNWSIAGAGSVTGFTYNHTSAFPKFTGTLPEKITRSAGVTISIAANTSNADSVYVLIAAGNQSVLKRYSAGASSVTIPSSDLSSLPAVSNNTAIIEVDPFRYTIQTINGKRYAFIKEYAKVAYVNID